MYRSFAGAGWSSFDFTHPMSTRSTSPARLAVAGRGAVRDTRTRRDARTNVTEWLTRTSVVRKPLQPGLSPDQNARCVYGEGGSPPTKRSSSPHERVSRSSTSASLTWRGFHVAMSFNPSKSPTARATMLTAVITNSEGHATPPHRSHARRRDFSDPTLPTLERASERADPEAKAAVEAVKQRARRNYKTAVPQLHRGEIQLVLPLSLDGSGAAHLALVIRRAGNDYIGETILPLSWAVQNARLLARPDRDWLVPT